MTTFALLIIFLTRDGSKFCELQINRNVLHAHQCQTWPLVVPGMQKQVSLEEGRDFLAYMVLRKEIYNILSQGNICNLKLLGFRKDPEEFFRMVDNIFEGINKALNWLHF